MHICAGKGQACASKHCQICGELRRQRASAHCLDALVFGDTHCLIGASIVDAASYAAWLCAGSCARAQSWQRVGVQLCLFSNTVVLWACAAAPRPARDSSTAGESGTATFPINACTHIRPAASAMVALSPVFCTLLLQPQCVAWLRTISFSIVCLSVRLCDRLHGPSLFGALAGAVGRIVLQLRTATAALGVCGRERGCGKGLI